MHAGKSAYLHQLTSACQVYRSAPVGKDLQGSSPPSVFIGSYQYPDVFAGPMIAPLHGDTTIMDLPEAWVGGNHTQEEILSYRMNLVRGKTRVNVTDLSGRFVEKLQGIALSDGSVESEAGFSAVPTGSFFSEETAPYGPSAPLERLEISDGRWDRSLEKVFYDTDLRAADAVIGLHDARLPFSQIQKAFSAGTMGGGRDRRLVPTRWSITACDTMIGNHLLGQVRKNTVLDTWRVHEFSSLHNNYAVILSPTAWQYEWTEAFLHVLGREELIFSDWEGNRGKSGYSPLGGCYYSCKMAVLEALARQNIQAGAIILREALPGYVPMGVFNVRENVRAAMDTPGTEFSDLPSILSHLSGRFRLPIPRFMNETELLRTSLEKRQTSLAEFGARGWEEAGCS